MIPSLKRPNIYFFMLLLAPFIKPVFLDQFAIFNLLYTAWKLCTIAYLFVALMPCYFRYHSPREVGGLLCLTLFWMLYSINCYRAGADFTSTLVGGFSAVLCFMLITYEAKIGNGWLLLKAAAYLSTILILLHVATMFLFPTSPSTVFFFGMDNYSAFYVYPMLSLVLFYHSKLYGRLKAHSLLLALITVFAYIYTRSYTAAAAGLLFLMLLMLYPHFYKIPKIRGVRWFLPLLALVLVLIVKYNIQNKVASLLNSMSKGVTLNSRTIIWDHALSLISSKPLFGHGSFTQEQLDAYILYGTTHAHNIFLELLMRTGIVGTILYLLFLCGFIPPLKTGKPESHHNFILVASLISQLALSFMDFYPVITIFYIFLAFQYSRNLIARPEKSVRRPL